MRAIPGMVRIGAVVLTLSSVAIAQESTKATTDKRPTAEDTYQRQHQGDAIEKGTKTTGKEAQTSNPGFGPLAPNDVTQSGGQPHLNSTYQKDRNGNQGLDLGWFGLLGLAGLFGLARGRRADTVEHSHTGAHTGDPVHVK